MSKVIKIKESKILSIISKIITEQDATTAVKQVSASGELGTTPNYDGLKTLLKTLKGNVEKELRGQTPYIIKNGNSATFSKTGNALNIFIDLVPCKPEERYWYFDLATAVYSYSTDNASLNAALQNKLAEKSRYFAGSDKKHVLKPALLPLDGITIDPNSPDKKYHMLIGYVAGEMPEGLQQLTSTEAATTVQPAVNATPEKPVEPKPNTTQQNAAITRPISGSFMSNNGDSAHNFKELETKIGIALDEMYKAGTNPKIKSVTAKIINNKGIFSTSYVAEIGPSDDGKAWMGFTARGSFGADYAKRADGQISGSENKDGRSLEEKLKSIGAGEIVVIGQPYEDATTQVKEYFVQFTKPKEFPAH